MKTFTVVQVIDLLEIERQRGIDVANYFRNKAITTAKHTGIEIIKLVRTDVADECRQIGNSISGLNALHPKTFSIRDKIKEDYKEDLE